MLYGCSCVCAEAWRWCRAGTEPEGPTAFQRTAWERGPADSNGLQCYLSRPPLGSRGSTPPHGRDVSKPISGPELCAVHQASE